MRNFNWNIVAVVLLVLWMLGFFGRYRMNGGIHVLLVVALVLVIMNFMGSRKRK